MVIVRKANSYFSQDAETKVETPITEEEFISEYRYKTKFPYVNGKNELVYVIKEEKVNDRRRLWLVANKTGI